MSARSIKGEGAKKPASAATNLIGAKKLRIIYRGEHLEANLSIQLEVVLA